MRRISRRFGLVSAGAIALSACSANHNTVYRYKPLTDERDSVTLVDAKQRAILTRVVEKTGTDQVAIRRFCSEPSPDVFSVMAQSLAAGGSFGQTADPKAIEAAFNLAFSSAETGSTIPRTQTINMLRELMFRTCERYLSGGYDDMELSIQAVRDQRLMVSILAIEQLTGAVTPSPVVLRAGGSAGAGLGGEAIETFTKMREQKQKADAAKAAAKAKYDEKYGKGADGKDLVCTALEETLKKDPSAKVDANQKTECETLTKNKKSTEDAAAEAGEAYDIVKNAMETGGVSASTVADAIAAGGLNRASPGSLTDVAGTVERIVKMNVNDGTEVMLFCLKAIKPKAGTAAEAAFVDEASSLTGFCVDYLQELVKAETDRVAAQAAENRAIQNSVAQQLPAINALFDKFWPKVRQDADTDKLDLNKFKAILAGIDPAPVGAEKRILDAWKAGQSVTQTRTDFLRLGDRVQSALAN
jgi:hypothetical protein